MPTPASYFPQICETLKQLGYTSRQPVRVYGKEFEIISEPFIDGDVIAVQVTEKRETSVRTLRIPLPIVQIAVQRTNERREAA
jgi:hypothetical protein